jgi:hypothetical protein
MGFGSSETRLVLPPHTARLHLFLVDAFGSVHSSNQRSMTIVVRIANTPLGVECRGQAQNLYDFLEAI